MYSNYHIDEFEYFVLYIVVLQPTKTRRVGLVDGLETNILRVSPIKLYKTN